MEFSLCCDRIVLHILQITVFQIILTYSLPWILQIALMKKIDFPYTEWYFTKNCQELSDCSYIVLVPKVMHTGIWAVLLSTVLQAPGTTRNTAMPPSGPQKSWRCHLFLIKDYAVYLASLLVVEFAFWSFADTRIRSQISHFPHHFMWNVITFCYLFGWIFKRNCPESNYSWQGVKQELSEDWRSCDRYTV